MKLGNRFFNTELYDYLFMSLIDFDDFYIQKIFKIVNI